MTTAQLRDELRRQDDERQRTRYTRLFDTPPRKRKVAARLPAQLEVHADVNGGWWRVGLREGGTLYEGSSQAKAEQIHQRARRRGADSVLVGSIFGSY